VSGSSPTKGCPLDSMKSQTDRKAACLFVPSSSAVIAAVALGLLWRGSRYLSASDASRDAPRAAAGRLWDLNYIRSCRRQLGLSVCGQGSGKQ
jgi:hypothetical protein